MMAEFLLIGVCLGSHMNDNACTNSKEKFLDLNPEIIMTEKRLDRLYLQPLPEELKFTGGIVGVVANKEIKFGICRGIYIDLKDQGQGYLGYEYRW